MSNMLDFIEQQQRVREHEAAEAPIPNWCSGCGVEGHSDEDPHDEDVVVGPDGMTKRDWRETLEQAQAERQAEVAAREALYDEPLIDTPASIGSGSDSYPAIVRDVVRFKSGPNKGKVRKILVASVSYGPSDVLRSSPTGGYGWDKTVDVLGASVAYGTPVPYTRRERHGRVRWVREGGSDWQSVGLGEARDYRDPTK